MVESLILVALGFLVASLFALVALQFVWRRAVTQTTRRLGLDVKTYSDAEAFTKAGRAIPDLELALTQREQELAVLAERNANLSEAYETAQREAAPLRDDLSALQEAHNTARMEAQSLRDDLAATREAHSAGLIEAQNLRNEIDSLYMRLSQAESLAAERTGKLQSLQQQLGEFASILTAQQSRQQEAGQQLKLLGDRAANLNTELTEAIAAGASATWNHPAPPLPAAAARTPVPIQLDEKQREDFEAELAPVAPAEAELVGMELAERIEALKNTPPH